MVQGEEGRIEGLLTQTNDKSLCFPWNFLIKGFNFYHSFHYYLLSLVNSHQNSPSHLASMQFFTLTVALWTAGLITAGPVDCDLAIECSNGIVYIGCKALQECEAAGGSPPGVKRSPVLPPTCDIAIECSNGMSYTGCDAVEQCEAAGGHLVTLPTRRSPAPQLTCDLIVYCSNGKIYKGCDALQECEEAGGVSCGSASCETSKGE